MNNPSNAPQTPEPGTADPAKEAEPQSLQEPDLEEPELEVAPISRTTVPVRFIKGVYRKFRG